MSKRWIVAQDVPGNTEHVMWSLIDTHYEGVRGHLLGMTLAREVCAALNAAEEPAETR